MTSSIRPAPVRDFVLNVQRTFAIAISKLIRRRSKEITDVSNSQLPSLCLWYPSINYKVYSKSKDYKGFPIKPRLLLTRKKKIHYIMVNYCTDFTMNFAGICPEPRIYFNECLPNKPVPSLLWNPTTRRYKFQRNYNKRLDVSISASRKKFSFKSLPVTTYDTDDEYLLAVYSRRAQIG